MAAMTLDSVLSEDFRFTLGFEVGLKNSFAQILNESEKRIV